MISEIKGNINEAVDGFKQEYDSVLKGKVRYCVGEDIVSGLRAGIGSPVREVPLQVEDYLKIPPDNLGKGDEIYFVAVTDESVRSRGHKGNIIALLNKTTKWKFELGVAGEREQSELDEINNKKKLTLDDL